MTVYVDNAFIPFVPPHAKWRVYHMSHMFCADLDELHAMAKQLGLRRAWFQCPPRASWPHYDIAKTTRLLAIKLGAVEIEYRDLPDKVRELGLDAYRKKATGVPAQSVAAEDGAEAAQAEGD